MKHTVRPNTPAVGVLGFLFLAAAGCSSSADVPGEVIQRNGAGGRDSAPTPEDALWDPEKWVPTVRIEPFVFTDEERHQFYEDSMARNAQERDLSNPPDVELIAWAQGRAEYGEAQARCLEEAGFPTVSDGAGDWSFDPGVPESQATALDLAQYVCNGQHPLDPAYAQDWSEEQLGLVYDYWEQYYIPCMQAHGTSVDTSDKPSREAYIAAFHTVDRLNWWPSETSQTLPMTQQRALAEVCPPLPPDSAMYGQ